jgi:hypothetical protein
MSNDAPNPPRPDRAYLRLRPEDWQAGIRVPIFETNANPGLRTLTVACSVCGREVNNHGRRCQRRFCSSACRAEAWRARQENRVTPEERNATDAS